MAVNTYLLYFVVDSQILINEHKWKQEMMAVILKEHLPGLSIVETKTMCDGGFLTLYIGHRESFVTVRGYTQGLVTVNIEHYKKQGEDNLIHSIPYASMLNEIADALGAEQFQRLCPFKRGSVQTYFRTTDNRMYDLAIDTELFEEKSPYQLVQISRSHILGNVLILDRMPKVAVKNVAYAEMLMQPRTENYQDKQVIILGGGDGVLLWELLKRKPKFVLVLELDEVVIRASRTYLRDANGGILDNMRGPNHEIVIGECGQHLRTLLEQGRKFDYVFGGRVDIAYHEETGSCQTSDTSKVNQYRSFMKDEMNLSFQILKLSGKFMCHCTARPDNLKAFEDTLRELDEPVSFSVHASVAVACFDELVQCYQIWRSSQSMTE